MPVAKLIVEGDLDFQILNSIFAGSPAIEKGGSKNSLAPQASNERKRTRADVRYLRDRDFDFEPPASNDHPTVDRTENSRPSGWRWCRHSIENYLLEPAIVASATSIPEADYRAELVCAASRIRWYQVARWVIGLSRRELPPAHEFQTRPDGLNDIALPDDLSEAASKDWATDHAARFLSRVDATLSASAIEASWISHATRFDDSFVADVDKVLLWFSGKDLMAAMASWLVANGMSTAGDFRALVRDWMRANSALVLSVFPEWAALQATLRR